MQFGRASRPDHGENVQRGTRHRKKASRQRSSLSDERWRRRAAHDASGELLRGPRPETRRRATSVAFGASAAWPSRRDPAALRTGLAAGVPCAYFGFSRVSNDGDSNLQTRAIPDYCPTNLLFPRHFIRSASHCTRCRRNHSVVTLPQGCLPQRDRKRTCLKAHLRRSWRGELRRRSDTSGPASILEFAFFSSAP